MQTHQQFIEFSGYCFILFLIIALISPRDSLFHQLIKKSLKKSKNQPNSSVNEEKCNYKLQFVPNIDVVADDIEKANERIAELEKNQEELLFRMESMKQSKMVFDYKIELLERTIDDLNAYIDDINTCVFDN